MTKEQKVIRAKLGLLELARQLGNVSQACKMMGYSVEEAGTVVFLFLVGELLEGVAAGKARASIQALTNLAPETALLEQDGRTRRCRPKGSRSARPS